MNGEVSVPSIENIIKTHPFLEGMSPHQHRILSDCAIQARFVKDEVIFREGDPANRFYLIQTGSVALESYTNDRGKIRIQTIGPGEVLGWSWLIPPHFWHFDARALEPTEAIFFYGPPLRDECESDHDLGFELFKRISQIMLRRMHATRWQLLKAAE